MNPIEFIHTLDFAQIPKAVRHQAKRCLLDTVGVALGGFQTELCRIAYQHAVRAFGGSEVGLWCDARRTSIPGAVLAHGMCIDALDLHDTCLPVKGHAGVAQIPTALATLGLDNAAVSGKELITTLVMAYEIAIRGGTAQHATVCDYHTSGSWNAAAAAAIVARRLRLKPQQTRHALGIAEYHGPRSQMMRAIKYPSMLKDGSGWGGMAGVSAGLLAADGFTGAPAVTVEGDDVEMYWQDLTTNWSMSIQYFKPYAVCYWAQPALAGAAQIVKQHHLTPQQVAAIRVYTFRAATRLETRFPDSTEAAQYSLPFPLGALLVHGQLLLAELTHDNLKHAEVLRLSGLVELVEDDYCEQRFPTERWARVEIDSVEQRTYDSGYVKALWGDGAPPSDDELVAKFRSLARLTLDEARATQLEQAIWEVEALPSAVELNDLLNPAAKRAE